MVEFDEFDGDHKNRTRNIVEMDFHDYTELVFKIVGAAINVQKELNWGLHENIYNEALYYELLDCGIQNEIHKYLPCFYKHRQLETHYQMDLVIGDEIVAELKSVSDLVSGHRSQLFNYMRLTRRHVGLLINFGEPTVQVERYALIDATNECILLDKNMDPVRRFKSINPITTTKTIKGQQIKY